MAARLTDKQKKEIIADYVESGSYRATAKKFGVSDNTVKKICNENAQIAQKCAEKREQNTADILDYMESRKEKAKDVLDAYIEALKKPEKIEAAKLSEIATAMGIVIDKFINNPMKHQLDKQKLEIEKQRFELEKKKSESGKEESNELVERLIDAVKRVE